MPGLYRGVVGVVLAVSFAAGVVAGGQSPADAAKGMAATPVFDVSTIKPSKAENGSVSIRWTEATWTASGVSMETLLENAFGIRGDLISGLPKWAKSDRYDIVAKATDADMSFLKGLSREQHREAEQAMLQRLIEDRFHLKSHTEVKELPVYDLVPAKGGAKFTGTAAKLGADGCKGWMSSSGTNMKMECVPIDTLTQTLAYRVERTVIDKTGLPPDTGYTMELKWRRDGEGPLSDADMQLPTIFDALQEQLGLKLESAKGPVKTLVVDALEKPAEN